MNRQWRDPDEERQRLEAEQKAVDAREAQLQKQFEEWYERERRKVERESDPAKQSAAAEKLQREADRRDPVQDGGCLVLAIALCGIAITAIRTVSGI
jgi:hypothetical protein